MSLRLFRKREKPWVICLRPIETSISVKIRTPPSWKHFPEAYIDLLDRVLHDYEVLALSQLVDEGQWDEEIPDRQEYADALCQRYAVQTAITAAFDRSDPPEPRSDSFILHLAGHPNRALLQKVLGFGMDSLPNIMYALQRTPNSWPLEVLTWNKVFVRWFRLRETDTALLNLVEQSGLLCCTIDRYLYLVLPQASEVDRILAHVKAVAQRLDLRVAVERDRPHFNG